LGTKLSQQIVERFCETIGHVLDILNSKLGWPEYTDLLAKLYGIC